MIKFEARNTKLETNSKFELFNFKICFDIKFSDLFRVSRLGFRI